MKKSILFCSILFLSFFSNLAFGQYLKGVSKGFVFETDTCPIIFYFSNAQFTKHAGFSVSITTYQGYGFYNDINSTVVLNDSTIQVNVPPAQDFPFSDSLYIRLATTDERMEIRELVKRLPLKIFKFVPSTAFYCYPTNNVFDIDSIEKFAKLTLASRGTHFTEPGTEFGYEKQTLSGFTKLDSVQVVSDTLAYLFFPKPSPNSLLRFGIQYRNKRDGLRMSFSHISFTTGKYGTNGILLENYCNPGKIIVGYDTTCKVEIKLTQNAFFNPDTLSHSAIPTMQVANYLGDTLPGIFSPYSILFDSVPDMLGGGNYRHRAVYVFFVPILKSLPNSDLDLIFMHPQLEAARLPAEISVRRQQSSLNNSGFSYPGMDFQISIQIQPYTTNASQIQIEFPQSSHIGVDSVGISFGTINIYGHCDSLCSIGKYDMLVKQQGRTDQIIKNALNVSQTLPLMLRFYPHNRVCAGRTDSSKIASSINTTCIPINDEVAPIRILKNGVLYTGIRVYGYGDVTWNHAVKIEVDPGVQQGWYDAEIYDLLLNKWFLQKEAIYVMGSARAKDISPKTLAYNYSDNRNFICWFKETHFTQAKDIRLGESYFNPVVINDTCIKFMGRYGDPAFYNEIDGFIGNDFTMNFVDEPSITAITPNWIVKGDTMHYTLYTDATSWMASPNGVFAFITRNTTPQSDFTIYNYKVVNDTILEFDMSAPENIETGYYGVGVRQALTFFEKQRDSMLLVLPNGIKSNSVIGKSTPTIYPNPSTGVLNFEVQRQDFSQLEILDLRGKVLYSEPISSMNFELNMAGFINESGIYLIRLSGRRVFTQKIIFNP